MYKPDNKNERENQAAFFSLTLLFFLWGFLTSLNDILIPHLKALFTLSYTQAMLVQFCFFTAYFLVSLPGGALVQKVGFKFGVVLGLLIAGLGCLLFYPAAAVRNYNVFLFALFVLAAGICILQVAANPYVTALGRPESASSRLTLTQAFNALGATLGPYFGAWMILGDALSTSEQATNLDTHSITLMIKAVQTPYLGLAATLFMMALLFAGVSLPPIEQPEHQEISEASPVVKSLWRYPHLIFGAFAIFVYVGAEVSIGSFMVSYLGESRVMALPAATAGEYLVLYWGGAMLGRFAGALIMRRLPATQVLSVNAAIAVMLVLLSVNSSGMLAMSSMLAVGLCNSIMFPTIFALAVSGLGLQTAKGSGVLCAAIIGGAIIPLMQGALADAFGLKLAFLLPALCYIYIIFYARIYTRLLNRAISQC